MNAAYNKGLVVSLSISAWSGQKLDKTQTAKTTRDAHASPDAARVNKHLVSKESLAEVQSASGAIRQYFYKNTLPWSDNGDRILGAAGFIDFTQGVNWLIDDFNSAVDHFITVLYPQERARAQFRMGAMFVSSDYPDPEELRKKFSVRIEMHGVPQASDFRVSLQEEDIKSVRAHIEETNAQKLRAAMASVWDRMFKVTRSFLDVVSGDSAVKAATVKNLQDLCDKIPALNITDDKNIAELCDKIRADFGSLTAKDLGKDKSAREDAKAKAQAVMNRMESLNKLFTEG